LAAIIITRASYRRLQDIDETHSVVIFEVTNSKTSDAFFSSIWRWAVSGLARLVHAAGCKAMVCISTNFKSFNQLTNKGNIFNAQLTIHAFKYSGTVLYIILQCLRLASLVSHFPKQRQDSRYG